MKGIPPGNSVFFCFYLLFLLRLGCRDIPAQGLTPPLHPRKGHRPLTLFRWRVPLGVVGYCASSLAMVRASRFQLMKPPFITGLPSKGL